MPTTRHRRTRGRATLTLDDLGLEDLLAWLAGWHPPISGFDRERSRWQTWEQFDTEYGLLRDEFLAHEWTQNSLSRGERVFAEERYLAGRPLPVNV